MKGAGFFSMRVTAFASLPTMVLRGGAEAWPPSLFMSRKSCIWPFSEVPTSAQGASTPGNTPETTAPPSSSTKAGTTPRRCSSSTMSAAESPAISSSPEKAK